MKQEKKRDPLEGNRESDSNTRHGDVEQQYNIISYGIVFLVSSRLMCREVIAVSQNLSRTTASSLPYGMSQLMSLYNYLCNQSTLSSATGTLIGTFHTVVMRQSFGLDSETTTCLVSLSQYYSYMY